MLFGDWTIRITHSDTHFSGYKIWTVRFTVCFRLQYSHYCSQLSIFNTWRQRILANKPKIVTHFFGFRKEPDVYTTPKEFENGGFTPKTHQMFSVRAAAPEEIKKHQSPDILDLCFWEDSEMFSGHTETKNRVFKLLLCVTDQCGR